MAYQAGDPGTLWEFVTKINADTRSFNLKLHLVGTDPVGVLLPKCVALAGYLKKILPTDCEIFYATLNNNNSTRDSRFVRAAQGRGQYVLPGVDPPDSVFDFQRTHLLLRLENVEGQSMPLKVGPIPDNVLTDDQTVAAITDVVGTPAGPLGAIGSGADWYANFNLLMQAIVFHCKYVKTGHPPGGPFQYAAFSNAFVLRPSAKRGGRIFA